MMKSLIASFSLFVLSPSLATAGFTTNVCFTINASPVVGALVKCWDDDYGWDDRVGPSGGARTDSNGCVSLYDSQSWWENPDVFCRIDPNGDCFAEATTSTKSDHNKRRDANFGTVALQYDEDYCGDFGGGNGCGTSQIPSFLRDTLTETSGFKNQCNAHDICYGDCSKKRSDCDDDFYDDMLSTCAGQVNCELLAYFYFTAVDTLGYEACDNSRRNDCDQAGLDRCNQYVSPFQTPTTASPSSSPTQLPITTDDDESCDLVDDEMFRKKNKSCRNWVGNKKGKKMKKKCKKKHKKKKVFVWCPVTCGEKAGLGKCAFMKKKNNNKNKKKKN
jgi:hypothetical protein